MANRRGRWHIFLSMKNIRDLNALHLDELAIPAEAIEQFERDGFYIARGFLSADEVKAIQDAFMEEAKNGPVEGLSEMKRGNIEYNPGDPLAFYPRMFHPHRHRDKLIGELAYKHIIDPKLFPLLKSFMHDEPVAVQSMFYFKPPGARGQDLHQDNFYLRVKPGSCCAAWIAIDDCDEENGGMMVVPGTQSMEVVCPTKADSDLYFTSEHVEPPPGLKPEYAVMKAGDVLFFNGSVVHGSTPNLSKTRFRRSLIFHYAPMHADELSNWYRHPLRFDGTELPDFNPATGGGPCGTPNDTGAIH
jgi:phytanoyl-CoA hydroxylase